MEMGRGYCSLCLKEASLMCRRCFQVYCSIKCQALDWSVHKSVCIEMPTLAPLGIMPGRTLPHSEVDFNESGRMPKAITCGDKSSISKPLPMNEIDSGSTVGNKGAISKTVCKASNASEVACGNEIKDANSAGEELNNWRKHFEPLMRDWTHVVARYVDDADATLLWVTEKRNSSQITKLHSDMYSYLTRSKNNCCIDDIALGNMLIADFGDTPYRAEVFKVYRDTRLALVRFIDFGVMEKVHFNKLYKPDNTMLRCKAFAFCIQVHDAWNASILDRVLTIRVISALKPKGYYVVELKQTVCVDSKINCSQQIKDLQGISLNPMPGNTPLPPPSSPQGEDEEHKSVNLSESRLIISVSNKNNVPVKVDEITGKMKESLNIGSGNLQKNKITQNNDNDDSQKLFMLEDLEVVPLPTGHNVALLVIDASQQFKNGYIDICYSELEPLAAQQKNLDKVEQYCKNNTTANYCPKKGEICLAIYEADEQWYRAVCLQELEDDYFQIQFVDYGNRALVKRAHIMALPKELRFPTICNRAYISASLQSENITNYVRFKATVEKRDNNYHVMNIKM